MLEVGVIDVPGTREKVVEIKARIKSLDELDDELKGLILVKGDTVILELAWQTNYPQVLYWAHSGLDSVLRRYGLRRVNSACAVRDGLYVTRDVLVVDPIELGVVITLVIEAIKWIAKWILPLIIGFLSLQEIAFTVRTVERERTKQEMEETEQKRIEYQRERCEKTGECEPLPEATTKTPAQVAEEREEEKKEGWERYLGELAKLFKPEFIIAILVLVLIIKIVGIVGERK